MVRLIGNLFVVMTVLLLGLMVNSFENALETNRNPRTLATELILLDRTMRALVSQAEDARRHLLDYVQTSLREETLKRRLRYDAAGISLEGNPDLR